MRDVVVHFGQQFVQLAGGDVAFHLLIPRVVLPIAKTARDVCALFERQRGNRSLDFSNRAHAGKLSAIGIGVNQANVWKHQNLLMSFFIVEHGWHENLRPFNVMSSHFQL